MIILPAFPSDWRKGYVKGLWAKGRIDEDICPMNLQYMGMQEIDSNKR